MLITRYSHERGLTETYWLLSRHTFSFGHYRDPHFINFGPLRVINEDIIKPGTGFNTHAHDNMEIITYVIKGELIHKDSTGTISIIKAGDIQLMCAGTGIEHSEFNNSNTSDAHFLQIWIIPNKHNAEPNYQQKSLAAENYVNEFKTIISNKEVNDGLIINQDTQVLFANFKKDKMTTLTISPKRCYWLYLINGNLKINDICLEAGDSLGIQEESSVNLYALSESEVLLFDLPIALSYNV